MIVAEEEEAEAEEASMKTPQPNGRQPARSTKNTRKISNNSKPTAKSRAASWQRKDPKSNSTKQE